MTNDNDSTFATFLADLLGRIDRGEAIDRERLLDEHEELRPQLESFFRGQSLVGELLGRADLATNGNGNGQPPLPGRFAEFELLDEIGRGGMGVVYRARQLRPERIVALKMVLAGRHASPTALARFQAEAQAAARLRHPSIVPIHQVGEHDGLAYYVMDLIEGESLDDRLARGPLSPRIAAEMLLEVARAVAHAHQHGVIHRDLKPANILIECSPLAPREETSAQRRLLAPREQMYQAEPDAYTSLNPAPSLPAVAGTQNPAQLYITDFGLARLLDSNDQLTATGEVIGTASYMAPEQAGSFASGRAEKKTTLKSTLSPAVDIYGLGAVLYAMLTGRPPFQAASRDETIAQLKTKDPAPPRSINAAIPRDLETIALKCLQKDPSRRYPSAAAVAEDLARYLAGRPITARPVGRTVRAIRLVRRNPVTSSLVSLLALSLVAGSVIGVALAIRANRHASDSAHHLYVAHMNLAQQYWDAGRAGPVLDILRRYIPKEGEPDVRGWEWHYQWSLCHRELRRFGEWTAGVQCVAVSPDGLLTAAAGDEGVIQVFDTATGELQARLSGHKGTVYALTFSPDGSVLASGGVDRHIRLWAVATLPPLPLVARDSPWRGEGRGEGTSNLEPGTLNLERAILSRHTNDIRGLAFSPDGLRLISSSEDGNAWLWDMRTHEPLRSIHTGPARAIAFHPDGERFACAARDGVIHFWSTATGDKVASYPGHSQSIYGLAFNRTAGRLFSAGSDGIVRCLDTSNGDVVWSVTHSAGFNCLSLAADERTVAAGSDDQTVRLYDAATGEAKGVYRGHTDWVHAVAFLPDGSRLISASVDGTVRMWNELCADEGSSIDGHELQVTSLAFSPDGRILATASIDGTIGLFDTTTGLRRRRLFGPVGATTAVAFHPHAKRFAAGSEDHLVYVWNMSEPFECEVLRGHTDAVGDLAFSPDGSLMASAGSDDTVRIWDLAERHTRHVLRADAGNVGAVAFSPNGKWLVSGHDDGAARVWTVSNGQLQHDCRGQGRNARGICFSPDDAWFASSGGDGAVRIWGPETGDDLQTLRGHDGTVYSISVSPDGSRIASGGNDQTIKLWDVRSGQELRTLRFGEQVRSVAFSSDGLQIAASGANGTVRIWEAAPARHVESPVATGMSGFEPPDDLTAQAINREALGLVIHLMESSLTKAQARELLAAQNSSPFGRGQGEGNVAKGNGRLPSDHIVISPQVRTAALALLDEYPLDEFASHSGHRFAESGNWPAAAAAFARASEAAPDDIEYRCSRALCEVKAGRPDDYLRVCREVIERFKNDERLAVLSRLLDTCLVVPRVPLDDLEPFANRLETRILESGDNQWSDSARRAMLAQIAFRRGDFHAADEILHDTPTINLVRPRWQYLKALIQATLGKPEALESFAEAETFFTWVPLHWSSRVYHELLRDEAREAIERTLGTD